MTQNSQPQSTRRTTRRANHRRPRHQRRTRNKLPQNKYGVIPAAAYTTSQYNSLANKKGGPIDTSVTNRRSSSQSSRGGNKPSKKGFGAHTVTRSIMQPASRKNSANASNRQNPNSDSKAPPHNGRARGHRRLTKIALVLQRLGAMGCDDVDRTVVQDVFHSLGGNVDKTIEFFLPADTERKEPPEPLKLAAPLSPTMMSPLRHSPLTYPMYTSSSPSGACAGARVLSRSSPANPQDMSVVDGGGLPSFSLGPAHQPTTGFARGSDSFSLLREQPHPRATDPFWTIPADITLEIFEFFQNSGLATISKVSRDARLLVREALSTVSILKFHKYSHWDDRRILSMIQCHRNLDALSLRKCGWFVSFSRLPDAAYPSTLSKLDVSSCYELCDHHVCAMATGFSRLLILDVSHTEISDVAIDHIWSNCSQLADLRLQGCDCITDHGIRSLLTRCTTLTSLNVRKTEITAAAFEDHFGWRSAVQVDTPLHRSRANSTAQTPTTTTTTTDSGILSPATGIGLAVAAAAAAATDIFANAPYAHAHAHTHTSSPSLSGTGTGTDTDSRSSARRRRGSGKFGRRTSFSQDVRTRGFSLTNLDTRDCRRISELFFVSPLCNLTSLNMSFSPSLLRAHMAVPMLKHLNISSSKNIKSLALRLPVLETLNLSQCTSLRDFEESIECPSLKNANLNQCRSLDRQSLMALCASAAHSLGELSLVGMITLSDADVANVLSACGNLSSFDLAGCRNISARTRRFVEGRVLATDTEQRRKRAAAAHFVDDALPLDLSDPSSWDFSHLGPEAADDD